MVNNVVVHMSLDVSFDHMCEEVVKGGMNMFKVWFLEDNMVLLASKRGEHMDYLIKHNKEWFESLLENIGPWSETLVVDHKIAWIICYGIPFPL